VLDPRITFTRTSSGTFIDSAGVLQTASSNVARFTHGPVTLASQGLLIEEVRTNLLPRSEQFDTAPWTPLNGTPSSTLVLDPAGGLAAHSFIENTASGNHQIFQTLSTAIGVQTFSIFVKAAGRTSCQLLLFNGTDGSFGRVNVNLNTGVLSSVIGSAFAQQFLNGWWRISVTGTSTVLSSSANLLLVNGGATSYLGDGASGVLLYGAQLEAGAFASSYIQTTTTALARAADVCEITGTNFTSWYNPNQGTFVAEFISAGGTLQRVFEMSGVTRRIILGAPSAFFDGDTASAVVSINANGTVNRIAAAYTRFTVSASANGAAVVSLASTNNISATGVRLGDNFSATRSLNGTLARLTYYPVALSAAQLQALSR
jgi:hypothetical protein